MKTKRWYRRNRHKRPREVYQWKIARIATLWCGVWHYPVLSQPRIAGKIIKGAFIRTQNTEYVACFLFDKDLQTHRNW